MRRSIVLMLVMACSLCGVMSAHALPSYLTIFRSTYPVAVRKLDQCKLCHINPAGGGVLNEFGTAFDGTNNFYSIELLDSDGDGFTNIEEITAFTWPGDAASHPAYKNILWRDTTTGAIAVWYMNGITHTGYADVGSAPTEWQVAGVQ